MEFGFWGIIWNRGRAGGFDYLRRIDIKKTKIGRIDLGEVCLSQWDWIRQRMIGRVAAQLQTSEFGKSVHHLVFFSIAAFTSGQLADIGNWEQKRFFSEWLLCHLDRLWIAEILRRRHSALRLHFSPLDNWRTLETVCKIHLITPASGQQLVVYNLLRTLLCWPQHCCRELVSSLRCSKMVISNTNFSQKSWQSWVTVAKIIFQLLNKTLAIQYFPPVWDCFNPQFKEILAEVS